MKKSFILLLLVCNISAFLPVKAQEYLPFPTADAEWKTVFYNLFESSIYDSDRKIFLYTIENDTAIGGVFYKKLNLNDQYYAALREEDKRIYIHFSEYGEHLVYDFNLEVGDTIFYTLGGYFTRSGFVFRSEEHFKVVESIENYELATGEVSKKIDLRSSVLGIGDSWVEGMGDIGMFLSPFITDATTGGDQYLMICFRHESNVLYLSSLCNDCSCGYPPGSSINNTLPELKISPNPFTNICSIYSSEANICGIALFDYSGKKIKEIPTINAFETEIELPGYPSGVYFIQVTTALGVVTQKIIKQ